MSSSQPDIPITSLPALLAPGQRLAGLDLGTKTIGIALSTWACASPRPSTQSAHQIRQGRRRPPRHLRREKVGGLILGLP
jgi:putative Holliday junction resolvase